MLLSHAKRIQGYLVAKSQSHEVIVIVNKASVNGGHCQDSSLFWLVVKVFLYGKEEPRCSPQCQEVSGYQDQFQSHKSL